MIERVYIALGANLGDPEAQLREAVRELQRAPGVRVRACSGLYRSAPLGVSGQPDYLNSVVSLDTALAPARLLSLCKEIEWGLGRRPGLRWGPRVVDLDIALFGQRQVQEPGLQIPHAELSARDFVLAPLAELCPDLKVPGLEQTVQQLRAALPSEPEALSRVSDAAGWAPVLS